MTADERLETAYWIIDILPEQVKADTPGQYFSIEKYYLEPSRLIRIKRKHLDLILKLNCYFLISLDGEGKENPPPERIETAVMTGRACIRIGDAMIVSEPDELYLTLYNPDGRLLEFVRTLSRGEGLFVWQPPKQNE